MDQQQILEPGKIVNIKLPSGSTITVVGCSLCYAKDGYVEPRHPNARYVRCPACAGTGYNTIGYRIIG